MVGNRMQWAKQLHVACTCLVPHYKVLLHLKNYAEEESRSNFSLLSFPVYFKYKSTVGVVEGLFYHNYATTPTQSFLDLQGPLDFEVDLYISAVLALAAWLSKVQDFSYS